MSMNYVVASLKFDKKTLGKAAKDDGATTIAVGLMFLSSILAGVVALINKDLGNLEDLGVDTEPASSNEYFILAFVGQLIFVFLFAFFYAIALRLVGGRASTIQVVRIWGLTTIWTIIGQLVGFQAPGIGELIALVGFFAFLLGISSFSGKGMFISFIAMIIAVILVLIALFAIVVLLIIGILAIF